MEVDAHARRRLANAFTVLFGAHGDVTRQAQLRGQSRQALYRDAEAVVASVEGEQTRARLEELEARLADQATRLEQLEARLQQAVEIPPDVQAAFASIAQAEGVSLPVARRLLEVLDADARPRVARAAADEIFSAGRRS
jgi:hypothetical protein